MLITPTYAPIVHVSVRKKNIIKNKRISFTFVLNLSMLTKYKEKSNIGKVIARTMKKLLNKDRNTYIKIKESKNG